MFHRKEKSLVACSGAVESNAELLKYSSQGVHGIKKCHDPSDAVADIVFVHGLTGNRESTWTEKESGVFWPAHLLKKDVPKTRIMTFGYDANVVHFWAMASQNCVRSHALKLANALAQIRERTETEDRPIIFVTHSLGGLVFENAMLLSQNSAEPQLRSLSNSTIGVCFLGTPHCGASAANWASVLGSITNVVKTTNNSLLNVLKSDSEVLALIQGDFHTMLRTERPKGMAGLKITCFFEELPVRGMGEIVPKHSAILPGYNSIPIHANHMDMTKFASDEDEGYLSVSTEIMRWVRSIQNASTGSKLGSEHPQMQQTTDVEQSPSPIQDNQQWRPHYRQSPVSSNLGRETPEITSSPYQPQPYFMQPQYSQQGLPNMYPQYPYSQQHHHQPMPQNPGYFPPPSPPQPQYGNSTYNNYGSGKQITGSTFNGNITL